MGRKYILSNTIAAFTGPKTIVEIGAVANRIVVIHSVSVSQSTSETDDSTLLTMGRYTASGTGTNIVANVEKKDFGDAAFAGTAEDNHSVDISTGEEFLVREGISLLAGYQKIWTPEQRPVIRGGHFFGINLGIAVTSVTLVYEVEFEEIG